MMENPAPQPPITVEELTEFRLKIEHIAWDLVDRIGHGMTAAVLVEITDAILADSETDLHDQIGSELMEIAEDLPMPIDYDQPTLPGD